MDGRIKKQQLSVNKCLFRGYIVVYSRLHQDRSCRCWVWERPRARQGRCVSLHHSRKCQSASERELCLGLGGLEEWLLSLNSSWSALISELLLVEDFESRVNLWIRSRDSYCTPDTTALAISHDLHTRDDLWTTILCCKKRSIFCVRDQNNTEVIDSNTEPWTL